MIRSIAEVAARRDLGGRATVAELDNLIDPAQRQPEAEPTRVKQIEASGSLSREMAHAFNNLLGIITLNLELARERAGGGEVREMIDEALDAAWQGSELTGRLADFARSQSG
jgi:signal transduction histidine kinase